MVRLKWCTTPAYAGAMAAPIFGSALDAPPDGCQPSHQLEAQMINTTYELRAIGTVESPLVDRDLAPKQGDEGAPDAWLQIDPSVTVGLRDLMPTLPPGELVDRALTFAAGATNVVQAQRVRMAASATRQR